jgi:mono/diheme cytochrome c family protein
MKSRPKTAAASVLLAAAAGAVAACGTQGISVPKTSASYSGAVLFNQHCSGCHTLSVAGTQGSASNVKDRLRNQGPNFNVRKETVPTVLYAIRNGGFSGQIMPQNVVVGQQAQEVAQFLAKYAGADAPKIPTVEISLPGSTTQTTSVSTTAAAAGATGRPSAGPSRSAPTHAAPAAQGAPAHKHG